MLRVACAMTRASACGSSWLSVESRRVALATIATPSRADAPRRRPVAAVRHATAAEAPATHWAGRQKARAALASATRLMSESDRASFAAYDVEFVVEISRCTYVLIAYWEKRERGVVFSRPLTLSLNVCGSYVHSRRRTADRVCDEE